MDTVASADAPLAGIRVVEAASYVSVPFAGLALAQLGAEVVKVEPPGGDTFRRFGFRHEGMSAFWANVNQGKRSVFIDLKSEAGRAEIYELLDGADLFFQNWRPGVAATLGLDAATLSSKFPPLIHVAVTGYGDSGPKANRPVFDGLLQAASGMAAAEARNGPPAPTRGFVADKISALFVTQVALAALVARNTSGKGAHIDLAMLDVIGYFDFPDLCQDRTFLPPAPQIDLDGGRSGFLETADGYIAVSPVNGRQVSASLTAVGHPEWKAELKAAPDPTTFLNLLYDRLESVTRSELTARWDEVFLAHDVAAAVVQSIDEHFDDPQTVHNQLYEAVESPAGPMRRVRHPARIDGRFLPGRPTWSPVEPPKVGLPDVPMTAARDTP